MVAAAAGNEESRAWAALGLVTDPELPFLTVVDLGLIRHVAIADDGVLEVGLAPTYSGCPATAVIRARVAAALRVAGIADARVTEVLAPAWSSDWLTDAARQKLAAHGIAPPLDPVHSPGELAHPGAPVRCPRCESEATEELSRFGSTPCKALYRCRSCLEPFEYFKCI
jgi:ring-1,2-phenylacetyl-CoA epoxidase subunit PaaD